MIWAIIVFGSMMNEGILCPHYKVRQTLENIYDIWNPSYPDIQIDILLHSIIVIGGHEEYVLVEESRPGEVMVDNQQQVLAISKSEIKVGQA